MLYDSSVVWLICFGWVRFEISTITSPFESAAKKTWVPENATSQTGVFNGSWESKTGAAGFVTLKISRPPGPSATNNVFPANRIFTATEGSAMLPKTEGLLTFATFKITNILFDGSRDSKLVILNVANVNSHT